MKRSPSSFVTAGWIAVAGHALWGLVVGAVIGVGIAFSLHSWWTSLWSVGLLIGGIGLAGAALEAFRGNSAWNGSDDEWLISSSAPREQDFAILPKILAAAAVLSLVASAVIHFWPVSV